MPWIEKRIRIGFLKYKYTYIEVELIAKYTYTGDIESREITEYLVKDKQGNISATVKVYV